MNHERSYGEGGIEKGKNVRIVLKFIRHGERTKTGELTDYGREITKQRARDSGIEGGDFDAVKAVGSQAGPKVLVPVEGFTSTKSEQEMGRSLETAHIYGQEIAGEDALKTRSRIILSYESVVNPVPFDYLAIYNGSLPSDFENLPLEEKAIAAKRAQMAVIEHLTSLCTPEAEAYKKEVTGAFAVFILHTEELAKRINAGSRVLMPSGTHGGMIEPFLQRTLVRRLEDGREIHGFERVEEIGGDFDPSEAFNVEIVIDEKGNPGPLKVTWDNPQRPQAEMYLDAVKLQEAAEFYKQLHLREEIDF